MRLVIAPPLGQWRPRSGRDRPVIATGHQPWLWHPGILAKDIAMSVAAGRFDARPIHVVVDHDVHQTLGLELPVIRDGRLTVESLSLGRESPHVPAGCQPPLASGALREALRKARDRMGTALAVDLQPLIHAADLTAPEDHGSLAEQVAALTAQLIRPWAGEAALLFTSELLGQDAAAPVVKRMLRDADRCVRAYNEAVRAHPNAAVAPLRIERERVELPLWNLRWGGMRQRVFADLADSRTLLLIEEDGQPIDEARRWLAPRALLLSALMRRHFCDLFIHGMGGGVYDRATEQWWARWTGETMAPMAVVTADVHLNFDVPLAERAGLERAMWYHHHLPHNLDRVLGVNGSAVQRKHELLEHMDDDRDKARRTAAFHRIHRINQRLADEHPEALREADERLRRARLGRHNAQAAGKRDWCFALYPPDKLRALRKAVEARAVSQHVS